MDAVSQLLHGIQRLGQTGGGKGHNDYVRRVDCVEDVHEERTKRGDHIHKTGDDRVDDA